MFTFQPHAEVLILFISRFIVCRPLAIRLVLRIESLTHSVHCLFHARVYSGRNGGEHGGSSRAGLFGAMDTYRHIDYIGHHLHNVGRLPGHTTQTYQTFHGHTLLTETVDDSPGAETCRLHKRAEYPGRIAAEIESGNSAFERLICIWCSSSVEPVDGKFRLIVQR